MYFQNYQVLDPESMHNQSKTQLNIYLNFFELDQSLLEHILYNYLKFACRYILICIYVIYIWNTADASGHSRRLTTLGWFSGPRRTHAARRRRARELRACALSLPARTARPYQCLRHIPAPLALAMLTRCVCSPVFPRTSYVYRWKYMAVSW